MEKTNKKAVIYIRVSSKIQQENLSLDMQLFKCKEYCQKNNFDIIEIFCDVESGGHDDREQFNKLLSIISEKKFDFVVVYEISRISRKMSTGAKFFEELERYQIGFISLKENITNRMLLNIYLSIADNYRIEASERKKSNNLARLKQGLKGSGIAPLGYKYEKGKFVVDEEKVELVNNIFLSYIETKSVIGVSRQFGLSEAGVRHLLENRTYIGELPHGRTLYNLYGDKVESKLQFFKGQHEAIVPLEIFEEVQKIRRMSYKTYSSKDYKAIILFSGIVKCTCGGKMHQCNASKEKAVYYKCNSCGKMMVSYKIEKIVLKELFKMKEIKVLNDIKLDQDKNKIYEKNISSLKQKLEKYNKKRKKILDAYFEEDITKEEYQDHLKKLEQEKIEAEKRIEQLVSKIENKNSLKNEIAILDKLIYIIENRTEDDVLELRQIFKYLIETINVNFFKPLEIEIILR